MLQVIFYQVYSSISSFDILLYILISWQHWVLENKTDTIWDVRGVSEELISFRILIAWPIHGGARGVKVIVSENKLSVKVYNKISKYKNLETEFEKGDT